MMRFRRCFTSTLYVMVSLLFLLFQPVGRLRVRASAASSASPLQGGPSVVGQWSAPLDLGAGKCAIHTHLLPNGKILFWGRDKQVEGSGWIDVQNAPWQTYVWDPVTGGISTIPIFSANLFCSGHSLLPDGRLLVAGGHFQKDGFGESQTSIFDPTSNTWSNGPAMNAGRWYPTTCPLGNGETLTVSGTDGLGMPNNKPQVWQTTNSWRDLTSAQQSIYTFYPWMLLAPNGQVFDAGPDQPTWFLSTSGTGAWTPGPSKNYTSLCDYGSAAMYDDGKVLIVGGGTPPTASAEVINLSMNNAVQGQNSAWRSVGSMANTRRQVNLTLLPDGKLLATGGTSAGGCNPNQPGPPPAEIWDPATEAWSTMATPALQRLYHSTALLLPDGRVLSAGSGGNGPTTDPSLDTTKIEIYSPPYLFNGARPTITSAPSIVSYGQQFLVNTPDAASISKVTLVRLSSVTHSFNQDQRINYLSFRQTAGGLNVTAPGSGNLCPPGYYMMFLLNGSGVPSVASIIQLPIPTSPSNAIDDQRYFTRQQFYDILLREADAGGLAFWTNQINQCGNDPTCIASQRTLVSRSFWDSAEFQNRLKAAGDPLFNPTPPNGLEFNTGAFVSWCYKIYLARNADPGGLSFWTNNLNSCIAANSGNTSQCYNNVINAFITSSEYRNRFYKP